MVRLFAKLCVYMTLPSIIVALSNLTCIYPTQVTRNETMELQSFEPKKLQNQIKHKVIINLAIFYDLEFNARFGNKAIYYWEAVMLEVHMLFKTLSRFDITLQVTVLSILRV